MTAEVRPCERQCRTCDLWKHFSRFRSRRVHKHGGVRVYFDLDCLDCQQKIRNEKKNADRPLEIIKRRASHYARTCGVSFDFFWINLNYRALVPIFRAMLTPEGLCTSCGHPFDNERDVQIEHREPWRHRQDWARWHARNCGIACTNCNNRKKGRSYAQWLEDEEQARLSNEVDRQTLPLPLEPQGRFNI
jgi:5-methylcytosine-specific restriction endonuclease McrA